MFHIRLLYQSTVRTLQKSLQQPESSSYMPTKMSNVKALVDDKIAAKKVMMFSKTYCPFCAKAKKVFQKLIQSGELSSEDYEVMEIENNSKCDEIQNYLQSTTGARSVPRVFVKGKCIGGGDDVVTAHQNGSLVKMLA